MIDEWERRAYGEEERMIYCLSKLARKMNPENVATIGYVVDSFSQKRSPMN